MNASVNSSYLNRRSDTQTQLNRNIHNEQTKHFFFEKEDETVNLPPPTTRSTQMMTKEERLIQQAEAEIARFRAESQRQQQKNNASAVHIAEDKHDTFSFSNNDSSLARAVALVNRWDSEKRELQTKLNTNIANKTVNESQQKEEQQTNSADERSAFFVSPLPLQTNQSFSNSAYHPETAPHTCHRKIKNTSLHNRSSLSTRTRKHKSHSFMETESINNIQKTKKKPPFK